MSRQGVFLDEVGMTIRLNVTVDVDMAELSGWSAERIGAFFAGVAQVLAAQKGPKSE
jgi:hypothetical protein